MNRATIDQLAGQLRSGVLSRRSFFQRAAAFGLSAAAAGSLFDTVAAQDASPEASPVGSPAASAVASPVAYTGPVGTLSMSRDAYQAAILEHFKIEEAANTGGSVVYVQTNDIATLNPTLPADVYSQFIIALFNDPLVVSNPIDGSWAPGTADSWEIAADGVTYLFHLNPTV